MQEISPTIIKKMADEMITNYGSGKAALIPLLNHFRMNNVSVDDTVMMMLAEVLNMSPAAIYGVVSFYSFLDHRPKGKNVIRVCRTISCKMAGASNVAETLKSELGIEYGETTQDGLFALEHTNCIGLCNQAPAMLLNETAHIKLHDTKIKDLIEAIRETTPVSSNERRLLNEQHENK